MFDRAGCSQGDRGPPSFTLLFVPFYLIADPLCRMTSINSFQKVDLTCLPPAETVGSPNLSVDGHVWSPVCVSRGSVRFGARCCIDQMVDTVEGHPHQSLRPASRCSGRVKMLFWCNWGRLDASFYRESKSCSMWAILKINIIEINLFSSSWFNGCAPGPLKPMYANQPKH